MVPTKDCRSCMQGYVSGASAMIDIELTIDELVRLQTITN